MEYNFNSYPPKTDCALYRGTKLEKFEIDYLKDILKRKKAGKEIPIIYTTSFLSFSTNYHIAEKLRKRRIIKPDKSDKSIKVDEPSTEEDESLSRIEEIKKTIEKPFKFIAKEIKIKPVIKVNQKNLKFISPKKRANKHHYINN